MSGMGFSWWVGFSEERYHTECNTREEAVHIALKEQDGGFICEARKPDNIDLSGYFDASDFLETAEDRAYDVHADEEAGDPVFDVTPEDQKALNQVVRAAIAKWQKDRDLTFTGWKFTEIRNEEYIPPANDETDDE